MNDISGAYPITKNGQSVGSVNISVTGLMTVFEASSGFYGDGVYRLFAASENTISPIGVMMPHDNGLHMTKSFTKAALSALSITPDTAFFLAKAGEIPLSAPSPAPPPEAAPPSEPPVSADWHPINDPAVLFHDSDIANACKNARGALIRSAGDTTFLAIPATDDEPFPMMPVFCLGEPETIEGREYIIFSAKNGSISF